MNTVGANVGAGVVGIGVGKLEGEAVGVGVGNGLELNRERTARLQKFTFFQIVNNLWRDRFFLGCIETNFQFNMRFAAFPSSTGFAYFYTAPNSKHKLKYVTNFQG